MWIRTQNADELINIDNYFSVFIDILPNSGITNVYAQYNLRELNDSILLGRYKNTESAQQAFEDLTKAIAAQDVLYKMPEDR